MTKRFVKTHNTINWWAILDNRKELLEDEVVDLLNDFADENEQLKKENYELKQKNRGWRRYCESQITHVEFMEKVLENMGYSVVFDNEKQKWVIE